MDPFLGEITIFAGLFAPRGWALCHGQLLAINSNEALFSLLGTNYGGDGRTTFGLPDLRGRVLIHQGRGPGLSSYALGQKGGTETVTLFGGQLPSHNHAVRAIDAPGTSTDPTDKMIAKDLVEVAPNNNLESRSFGTDTPAAMANEAISSTGGSQPHPNIMPYLALNYIISLDGAFPSRA